MVRSTKRWTLSWMLQGSPHSGRDAVSATLERPVSVVLFGAWDGCTQITVP